MLMSKVHDAASGKPKMWLWALQLINNNRVVQVPKSSESVSPQVIDLSQSQ